ncbi:uncharacterized protein LOC131854374 [Achroia grisella]|uniref:uncharacterized protein LOC131854374 n=1 Tax=Achroia grisella TaxID=688607 RepID=UPI0027D28220|nr:uncharacterized protein LOC131854374 [Achroia grisella]
MWLYNDNTDGSPSPRRRQNLTSPDIPTRNNAALPIVSKHDQFIEFTHSDFDADAAQSTVPFIDIQPVSTYVQPVDHNVLLRGVGLMHRGMHGSGGYIALKLFSYDYTAHVRAHTTAFTEF